MSNGALPFFGALQGIHGNGAESADPDVEPIQLFFDFNDELEQAELPTEYPPRKPR
jgi:hypothetical protein